MHSTPGTRSEASSSSQPRTPVPIEAKRTVSLGATARERAKPGLGSMMVTFAAVVAAIAPVPTRMNSRRVKEPWPIEVYLPNLRFCVSLMARCTRSVLSSRDYPTKWNDRETFAWRMAAFRAKSADALGLDTLSEYLIVRREKVRGRVSWP